MKQVPPAETSADTDCELIPWPQIQAMAPATRLDADGLVIESFTDTVANEVPVALQYNGVAHAVMMATPADLEDFAVGFSLTEGIVESAREIFDVRARSLPRGIELALDIAAGRFAGLKERRRSLTGRTGCGICGAENLDHALRTPKPLASDFRMPAVQLHRAFIALRERQPLQRATGATHAAGWVDAQGELVVVREDVGRHNALDKLLGALARSTLQRQHGAVIVTSRASVEMVQKTAIVGIPILATISGPTALAINMANDVGLTLAAFFRERGHVRYAHGERLDAPAEPAG